MFCKKKLFKKLLQISPVIESLFNKAADFKAFFKNTYLKEHLRTAVLRIIKQQKFYYISINQTQNVCQIEGFSYGVRVTKMQREKS